MGRKPTGDVLIYNGQRYTWSIKGYWRSTCSNDRHNLTRLIWETHHGEIPPGHKVIYKDGNRFNVSIENLDCLSHSDFQKQRLEDPEYRMLVKCYTIYGQLIRNIIETTDPERRDLRYRKVWETRRNRYGNSGGNGKKKHCSVTTKGV